MRYAIDIDSVIYPFTDVCAEWYSKVYDHHPPPVRTWHWWDDWDMNQDEWRKLIFQDGVQSAFVWWQGAPITGALWGLQQIEDHGHEYVFITNRHGDLAQIATRTWLYTHGLGTAEVIHTGDKCAHDWDWMLDDSPKNLTAAWNDGRRGVAFDQPWNRAHDLCFARVSSWWEFVKLFVEPVRPH